MTEQYGTHRDYMQWVEDDAQERLHLIRRTLKDAFGNHIETRVVDVVLFSDINASELAHAILSFPLILKPLLVICNVARRAIERDLGIKNLDTYRTSSLSMENAHSLAGYLKQFLPPCIELPAIVHLDRCAFVDKEIRMIKGRWEKGIVKALSEYGKSPFKKRKFTYNSDSYEIDAASPTEGSIEVAVDIKRIEARLDIHKRCDEIANKAKSLKVVYPDSVFAAIIYYPFISEHSNVSSRLSTPEIEHVFFASESPDSIEEAVKLLLSRIGYQR